MKRTIVLLCVLMLACAAHGQNLLNNPDFTVDTSGWAGVNLGHSATDGYMLTGCAEVAKDFGDPDPIIDQCVNISTYPVGTRFVFGAWFKAANYDPQATGAQPSAQLNYFSDAACSARIGEDGGALGWPTQPQGIWRRYSAAGKLPPGARSVMLQVGIYLAPDEPTSITRIDDAFLEVVASPHGLVHLWPFNGNTDDVIGGADGVITGTPSYVQGALGLALSFDGIEEYVTAAADINPATMPTMTMGAWVVPGNGVPIRTVISHDNGGYDRTLCLDSRGSGGTGWSAYAGSGVMGGTQAAHLGQREFIAVQYNHTTNFATLYVNGTTESVSAFMGAGLPVINIATNPSYPEFFEGVIDEVFIFDRILTLGELDIVREFGAGLFVDDFERGDASRWALTLP